MAQPTKEFTDAQGRKKIKGNMDIELAIDIWKWPIMLIILLFSGDGDFRRLIEAVQRKAVRVTMLAPSAQHRQWSQTISVVRLIISLT